MNTKIDLKGSCMKNAKNQGYEVLEVRQVAEMIGKTLNKNQAYDWNTDDLMTTFMALQDKASKGGRFIIDGDCPPWMLINIMHALHPNDVAIANSETENGFVLIKGETAPKRWGRGPVPFKTHDEFYKGEGTLVYPNDSYPEMIKRLTPDRISEIVPPETVGYEPVYLGTNAPDWYIAETAMVYMHIVAAVYVYQPGVGFICAMTHNPNHQLGAIVNVET